MSRISYLQDVLSSVFERGRIFRTGDDKRKIIDLCDAIFSEKGEVSGSKLAANVLAKYEVLDFEEKRAFFSHIIDNFDLDPDVVIASAQSYIQQRTPANLVKLTKDAEPKRRELLRRLNQVPGATEKLVHMREDLLSMLKSEPGFASFDADFEHLFSSWFNRGFLVLKPIDWKTPANILEKIIEYEAVHAINDWDDLRRRLQPHDRRCFAFFHPAMPEEPLIFVEVALTKGLPASVTDVLAEARSSIANDDIDTAVFYSISNCQKGLRGVSFGNFLIKQVVNDLALDFPGLNNFVTLSPIPGFRKWLDVTYADTDLASVNDIKNRLSNEESFFIDESTNLIEKPIKVLLAKYFLEAKRDDGWPLDPVSRFHLGNGASLMRFNWMADISEKGLKQSAGLMVNYKYDLETVEDNHESYAREKEINTTREIKALAKVELK